VVAENGRVVEMTREEFEELVSEALDRIPPELTRLMDNVAVFVEDEPPPEDPELLGLYEGTPLTERGEWYAGALPDRISVYMGPTLRLRRARGRRPGAGRDGGRGDRGAGYTNEHRLCTGGHPDVTVAGAQPHPSSWSRASSIPKWCATS
jgi:hypothetical protein